MTKDRRRALEVTLEKADTISADAGLRDAYLPATDEAGEIDGDRHLERVDIKDERIVRHDLGKARLAAPLKARQPS